MALGEATIGEDGLKGNEGGGCGCSKNVLLLAFLNKFCWSASSNIFSILLGCLKKGMKDFVSPLPNIPRPFFFTSALLLSDTCNNENWTNKYFRKY